MWTNSRCDMDWELQNCFYIEEQEVIEQMINARDYADAIQYQEEMFEQ